ncbi:MAG TPA: hypothetical protein VJL89_12445 [Thermodesulfovibrionia bacterium]|nr:hypothetical protein [Thermodesulfovibrionia bacterium]
MRYVAEGNPQHDFSYVKEYLILDDESTDYAGYKYDEYDVDEPDKYPPDFYWGFVKKRPVHWSDEEWEIVESGYEKYVAGEVS